MSKKIDIVYFYEYAARELDVACAVKYLVRKKYGLRVEVLKWPEEGFHNIIKSRPRVVVLPFCYCAKKFYSCLMEWRDSIFFNLAWEQFFYRGNIKDKIPEDAFSTKCVMHQAWSSAYADFLSANGVLRENIFLNGNPALALYTQPYRKYFEGDTRADIVKRYGLDPAKRWVFFPENYRWAFCGESDIKYFVEDRQSEDDVRQMMQYCRKSLPEAIKWCVNAIREGGIEIIIRPRHTTPREDFLAYLNRTSAMPLSNIHVIQEGTVREWVLASDVVVSSYSTTLIEAAVAGKPVFMLEPVPTPEPLHVGWHDLVPKIRDESGFRKVCEGNYDTEAAKRLQAWALDTMLSNGDCIAGIAQTLGGLCENHARRPIVPRKCAISVPQGSRFPWWFWYALGKAYYLSTKNSIEKNRPGRIFRKYMANQEDIDRRVEKWKEALLPIT